MGLLKPLLAVLVAAGFVLSAHVPVMADQRSSKINQNTLGLLAADSQWLPQAVAIASAVHHDQGLRVLPIVGTGTLQAVSDLATLDSVDAALLPLDTLTYAQAQGLLQGIDGRISYLARLQPVNWALITTRNINNLTQLAGKRIATGPTGSMGFVAGELLFNAFEVPFARVPRQNGDALAILTQGAADAALVDASVLRAARLDGKRYKVLALALPHQLTSTYTPVMLGHSDVPSLIAKGADVETIAAPLAVMVFTRTGAKADDARLTAFATALFRNAAQLRINNNIAADIPGWARHRSATQALKLLAASAASETELQQGDGQ